MTIRRKLTGGWGTVSLGLMSIRRTQLVTMHAAPVTMLGAGSTCGWSIDTKTQHYSAAADCISQRAVRRDVAGAVSYAEVIP